MSPASAWAGGACSSRGASSTGWAASTSWGMSSSSWARCSPAVLRIFSTDSSLTAGMSFTRCSSTVSFITLSLISMVLSVEVSSMAFWISGRACWLPTPSTSMPCCLA